MSYMDIMAGRQAAAYDRAQARYDAMEPPDDGGAWDAFAEWCDDNGTTTDAADFDQWLRDQEEAAAEARAEDLMDERKGRW